jgi:hypothetical protein
MRKERDPQPWDMPENYDEMFAEEQTPEMQEGVT